MKHGFVFVTLALAAAACGQKSTSAPAASPTPSAEPAEQPSDAPEPEASSEPAAPEKPLSVCDKAIQEFDKTLAEASFECNKDSDCGCFDSGLSRKPGNECGGVTDKAAAKKLRKTAKTAKKNACSNSAMCDAWTCIPICEEHRCQKGPHQK